MTPGPWHQNKHIWWRIDGPDDGRIGPNFVAETSREDPENARLIAAAPDLLDAARAMVKPGNIIAIDLALEMLKKAIAKAEGNP